MAVSTTRFDLTANAWTEIASGKRSVSVTNQMVFNALVHVGQAAPAIGSADYLVAAAGAQNAINLSGLAAGDKVFSRAQEINGATVVVLAGDE